MTTIEAPLGEHVLLNFTHFDLEGYFYGGELVMCFDTLTFFDVPPTRDDIWPFLDDVIGGGVCSDGVENNPPFSLLKSRGNSLIVIFQSDFTINRTGYNAIATSVKCKYILETTF